MPYMPPSGFVEQVGGDGVDPESRSRFHTRADCPRIRHPDQLRPVDRPWSAARCGGCAEFFGNDHERFRKVSRTG